MIAIDKEVILAVLTNITTIAIVGEYLVEAFKLLYPKEISSRQKQTLAMILCISLALGFKVSLFEGNIILFIFGAILAGGIASRGSSAVHSLYDFFRNLALTYKVPQIK